MPLRPAGLKSDFKLNIREHLWDKEKNKFIPHIYLDGSPFPDDFDEHAIHFHGGTAVAIEAGILYEEEIARVTQELVSVEDPVGTLDAEPGIAEQLRQPRPDQGDSARRVHRQRQVSRARQRAPRGRHVRAFPDPQGARPRGSRAGRGGGLGRGVDDPDPGPRPRR